MSDVSTTHLHELIVRLNAADPAARNELIEHVCERLRRLTRRLLQNFGRVRRWEDSEDVLQNAVLRLLNALRDVKLDSVQHFFNLATLHIRRELLDLSRHYFGPEGLGARHSSQVMRPESGSTPPSAENPPDSTHDPVALSAWTEFHARVDSLPAELREVCELLWYQGLTQPEAAAVLNVAVPTVKRRWLEARLRLGAYLQGEQIP
jgi:RNA polymerase sigma-70 factor (ECF subfamily)